MKIKTSDLIGPALDWAVAKCEGRGVEFDDPCDPWLTRDGISDQPLQSYSPSTEWAQGGPIIERHKIEITAWGKNCWRARSNWSEGYNDWVHVAMFEVYGQTPLSAAMRCYVASRFGDKIEVPDELC